MTNLYFDSYSQLEEWASENGYDADNFIDEEIDEGKHDYVYLSAYLHNKEKDTYVQISGSRSYNNGLEEIVVYPTPLKVREEQVIKTVRIYEEK